MRTNFERRLLPALLAVLLAWIGTTAHAVSAETGTAAKYGFIRLVNAIAAGTGPVSLTLDGQEPNPDGYQLGDVTGGIGLKPGTHTVILRRSGVEEIRTPVRVTAETTTTLIGYAEKIPATETKPVRWAIGILTVKPQAAEPATSHTASFVSVCAEPEVIVELGDPKGDWARTTVKRLSPPTVLPLKFPEGYAPLRSPTGPLEAIPISDPGGYLVVLYQDAENRLQAVSFRDFKFTATAED